MKKVIAFALILLQLLCLFSCKNDDFEQVDTSAILRDFGYAAQYIRTDGGYERDDLSALHIIRSGDELNTYYQNYKDIYQFDRDGEHSFLAACEKYDAEYFEKQILLMVIVEEPSGSNRHKVKNISTVYGKTTVEIDRLLPESGDDDMAAWHIIIEPEAGFEATEENIEILLDGKNITEKTETVKHSEGYANISLKIPEGWEYELNTEKEHRRFFSILYRPEGKTGGVRVCFEESSDGVCGTGLTIEKVNVGQYMATMGTYDDNKIWSYIAINDVPGRYVIYCEGADDWWKEYGAKAMEILDSLQVAEGCLEEWRALPVAKKKYTEQYESVNGIFNYTDGSWIFRFADKQGTVVQAVTVYVDGSAKMIDQP